MSQVSTLINPPRTPVADNLVATNQPSKDANGNTSGSIFWWVGLFVVFVLYGWLQNRNKKLADNIKPANLSANLHNIFFVTFAALIGLVAGKVFFLKVAAWTKNIPLLGSAVNYIAQLFAAV